MMGRKLRPWSQSTCIYNGEPNKTQNLNACQCHLGPSFSHDNFIIFRHKIKIILDWVKEKPSPHESFRHILSESISKLWRLQLRRWVLKRGTICSLLVVTLLWGKMSVFDLCCQITKHLHHNQAATPLHPRLVLTRGNIFVRYRAGLAWEQAFTRYCRMELTNCRHKQTWDREKLSLIILISRIVKLMYLPCLTRFTLLLLLQFVGSFTRLLAQKIDNNQLS